MVALLTLDLLFWTAIVWIAWVFLLYPGLMWTISQVRPRPLSPRPQDLPRIELITAAHNEEVNILRKINNYSEFDYPRELLSWKIGSDASTDRTDEIVARFAAIDPSIELVRFERMGKTPIIYKLAERSAADIILFTDADIEIDSGGLREIAHCFADPEVGGVVCRMVYHDTDRGSGNVGEGIYSRLEDGLRRWESLVWTTMGPTGQCFAVRRGAYTPLEDYRLSDDMYLAISIPLNGYRVWFAPEVGMHDHNSRTLNSEIRRRLRVGQQNGATFLWFPATRLPWRSFVGFEVWSHRLLRNISIIPMLVAIVTALALFNASGFHTNVAVIGVAWIVMVCLGWICEALGISTGRLGGIIFFSTMLATLCVGTFRGWWHGGMSHWDSQRD